jgi:hypothetical protein
MDRLLTRTLAAVALALIAMILLKAGLDVFEEGMREMTLRRRVPFGHFLGGHLLWLLAGVVGAGIIRIGSPASAERSVAPLLTAAVVPLLAVAAFYSLLPHRSSWLPRITPEAAWLVRPAVQAASLVLAGALLGTALWQRIGSRASESE